MVNSVLSKLVFYREDNEYVLATHEGDAAASASISDHRDGGINLELLYVNPWYRQNGLAKYLMTQVCKDADRNQLDVWLDLCPDADFDYTALEQFYESFGFVKKNNGRYMRNRVKRW